MLRSLYACMVAVKAKSGETEVGSVSLYPDVGLQKTNEVSVSILSRAFRVHVKREVS